MGFLLLLDSSWRLKNEEVRRLLRFAMSFHSGYFDPVQRCIYLHSNIDHVGRDRGSYGGQRSGRYSSLGLQICLDRLGCSRQCWTPRTFGHPRPRWLGSVGGGFGHGTRPSEKSGLCLIFRLISFRFNQALKTLVAGVLDGHLAKVRPCHGFVGLTVSSHVLNC